jgi:hypothetical protein
MLLLVSSVCGLFMWRQFEPGFARIPECLPPSTTSAIRYPAASGVVPALFPFVPRRRGVARRAGLARRSRHRLEVGQRCAQNWNNVCASTVGGWSLNYFRVGQMGVFIPSRGLQQCDDRLPSLGQPRCSSGERFLTKAMGEVSGTAGNRYRQARCLAASHVFWRRDCEHRPVSAQEELASKVNAWRDSLLDAGSNALALYKIADFSARRIPIQLAVEIWDLARRAFKTALEQWSTVEKMGESDIDGVMEHFTKVLTDLVAKANQEYRSYAETAYLLDSPANEKRLAEAIAEADAGRAEEMTLEEPRTRTGGRMIGDAMEQLSNPGRHYGGSCATSGCSFSH